jgi:CrcB protein
VACFALGLVLALNETCTASTGIALLMGFGFFGSLSTFSTFAVELLNELRAGQALTSLVLALASIGAGLLASAVGYGLGTHA